MYIVQALFTGEHVYCTFWRPEWGSGRGKGSRIGRSTNDETNIFSLKVEEAILEHWWLSYMELLHRLQLFTQGNQVGIAIPVWSVRPNN